MDTRRLVRLLQIIRALQAGRPYTAAALADLVGVSKRTVFRDFDLLHHAGLYYDFDRLSQSYSTSGGAFSLPASLSHVEAVALVLALRFVADHPFVLNSKALTSASLKLEAMLPPTLRADAARGTKFVDFRHSPASDSAAIAEIWSVCQGAIVSRRAIFVRYDSAGEQRVVELTLEPYRLLYAHRAWYLIALVHETNSIRHFKLERITHYHLLPADFRAEARFNLEEYLGDAWRLNRGRSRFHVGIRFSPVVAASVDEVRWHHTQATSFLDDGSLQFEADIDGLDEIVGWVLSYGEHAEVLEPPQLRSLIAYHTRRLVDYYGTETHLRERGPEEGNYAVKDIARKSSGGRVAI